MDSLISTYMHEITNQNLRCDLALGNLESQPRGRERSAQRTRLFVHPSLARAIWPS